MSASTTVKPKSAQCRNFVKEASVARINKQAVRKQYQPGVYAQHHPAKCEHILQNRPIHMKLNSATELKEMCTVITQDNIRDLLVPSETINVYPTIWSSNEMGRIRNQGTIVTKEQHRQQLEAVEAEKRRMEQECEQRKRHLRELDQRRGGGAVAAGGLGEDPADEDAGSKVLDRAFLARHEQEQEVQRANRLILAAKCHVIRDAQVAEKNELEREMRDEELRLERMMEADREKALRHEDMRREQTNRLNAKHGIEIKNQLRERELAKQVEAERIEEEAKAMAQGQIAITLDMLEREKERKLERLRVRTELAKANELNDFFKSLAFEEARIADMKAAEFMRQKQERDRQRANDARLAKEQKQREADRMLALQKRMMDNKGEQDEMSMRRVQEEKEREFRRRQKEAAELKVRRGQEMERARVAQLEEIKRQRALNIVREEIDFRGVVDQLNAAAERERVAAAEKHAKREQYRADVMQQIRDNELARRAQDALELRQHAAQLEKERERDRNIQAVISAKLGTMRRANIPDRFIKDVERNLEGPRKLGK